ncbi:MAG: hypothetical protein ACPH5G_17745 [Pseudooceanicola atlanticus]
MSKKISPKEQDMIDRALEEGKVNVLPPERREARKKPLPPLDDSRPVIGKTPPPYEIPAEMSVRQALEWAFLTERASMDADEIGAVAGFGFRGRGAEAVIEERFHLGKRKIDTSFGRSEPAEDAQLVASVLRNELPWYAATWIADLARAGRAPVEMVFETPRLNPVEWHTNQHGRRGRTADAAELGAFGWKPVRRRNRKGIIVAEKVEYTPCHWSPTWSQIAAARRAYLDWWGHLLTIQYALRAAGPRRFSVTKEMPPLSPWKATA